MPEGAAESFQLFEMMRVTRNQRVRHLDRHLERIERSAAALGFRFDRSAVMRSMDRVLQRAVVSGATCLRLVLARDGEVRITLDQPRPFPDGRVNLLIESKPLAGAESLAGHKRTPHAVYDEGVRKAELRGAYDSLFLTADGRMVEGGRSNVFVLLDGRWWTPPLSDGALPGVMRGLLLEDPAWQAGERTLRLSDVQRARSLMVCNAVRGVVPGRLVIDS